MATMSEEEKYKRKAALLQKALADADEMDAAYEKKAASTKVNKKRDLSENGNKQTTQGHAAAEPVSLDS